VGASMPAVLLLQLLLMVVAATQGWCKRPW
jgi:hypothetical protein